MNDLINLQFQVYLVKSELKKLIIIKIIVLSVHAIITFKWRYFFITMAINDNYDKNV